MTKIWAEHALTSEGWKHSVAVTIDKSGRITSVKDEQEVSPKISADHKVGILLPAPSNVHSHAFQRAMAGLTEGRGSDPTDSFWTWRALMYKFLQHLGPDEIKSISAFAQMQMLEAGFASVGEFHYLHNQPDGSPYAQLEELANCVVEAADQTGIGLTLLPVLYEQGGTDGRPLEGSQRRFSNSIDGFATLVSQLSHRINLLDSDSVLGIAAHSLRAVTKDGLAQCIELAGSNPIHIHIAEQKAEVDEIINAYGARPVEWLLKNHGVNDQWCLIHATQMTQTETLSLAKSKAIAGLCPITESNLGDGIFDGTRFLTAGGRFGVGSDSNVLISLSQELRAFEYSLRLKNQARAVVASPEKSTGRALYNHCSTGGAKAIGRNSGSIKEGVYADLLTLDEKHIDLIGRTDNQILDSFVFCNGDEMIKDVWSAGRHLVAKGKHVRRNQITQKYRNVMKDLLGQI